MKGRTPLGGTGPACTIGVSIMMIVLGLITLAAALAARETRRGSLT